MSGEITAPNQKEKPSEQRTAKGLTEAIAYVGRAWFPVNATVLEGIKERMARREYDYDRQTLIDDIKSDLGLFAYCIKELEKVVDPADIRDHPVKILKEIDIKAIEQILNVSEDKISSHRFEQINDNQLMSTKHAAISCSTTHLIASKTEHDPDVAASYALLRQLGFMLVAWNYPRTFEKAMSQLAENGGDLEKALFKYLGFSPTQLGVKLAADWNKSPALYLGVGLASEEEASKLDPQERQATEEIKEFCEVGEALARVNDPQHFPAGQREWSKVTATLTDYLGPDALNVLRKSLAGALKEYKKFNPQEFNLDFEPRRQRNTAPNPFGAKLLEVNTDIRKCPSEIQALYREMYQEILVGEISVEALNILVKQIIPQCGFTRGCVYLTDPDGQILVPKLKIGEGDISRYKSLRSTSLKFSHPVIEALTCQFPIKQENVYMYGELVSHVTGVFGTREKAGVLYLEMGTSLQGLDGLTPLVYFRSIKQALNDCLNLRQN